MTIFQGNTGIQNKYLTQKRITDNVIISNGTENNPPPVKILITIFE